MGTERPWDGAQWVCSLGIIFFHYKSLLSFCLFFFPVLFSYFPIDSCHYLCFNKSLITWWGLSDMSCSMNRYVDLLLGEFKHYKTRLAHGGIHKEVNIIHLPLKFTKITELLDYKIVCLFVFIATWLTALEGTIHVGSDLVCELVNNKTGFLVIILICWSGLGTKITTVKGGRKSRKHYNQIGQW